MPLTLDLPPDMERVLHQRAALAGKTAEQYAQHLLESVLIPNGTVPSTPGSRSNQTIDPILAPIRQGFQESGMTEEELNALFEEAREEVWQEKQQENL